MGKRGAILVALSDSFYSEKKSSVQKSRPWFGEQFRHHGDEPGQWLKNRL